MAKLKNYEKLVTEILYQHEDCRNSDRRLYLKVLEYMGFDTFVSVDSFFKSDTYPNIESIRRVRQKIQETNPDLRATTAREPRKQMEMEYLEYVRG